MDILSLVLNTASIIGMVVVAMIISVSSYSKTKLFFAIFIYTICLWLSIQYAVQMFSIGGEVGLKLIQFTSAISLLIVFLFYGFIRSYINKPISSKVYILFSMFFIVEFILNMSGQMLQKTGVESGGIVVSQSTFLYLIYIVIVGLIFVVAICQLFKSMLVNKSKKDKARNHLMISAFLQAIIIVVLGYTFLTSSSKLDWIVPASLLVMSILVGLAIIKYQLFDIKAAIIRTSAYALSLLTLAAVYFGLAYLTSAIMFNGDHTQSASVSPVNIILALLLAFIFQPIKKFFDKLTNKFFYKDNYSSDDFFARLNKILSSTIDLRALIERIAIEIGNTIKGEQAFLFIYTDNGHYMSAGTPGHKQLPKSDADQLKSEIIAKKDIIIASLLEDNNATKRLMISHRIELIMPLIQDEEIVGYLCLGEHKTSNYTNRDIKVLNTISNELIIAIQNALAVQEIREFNETLKQRIANATVELRASNRMLRQLDKAKDEFVGMASHQLRTPLTSVKGYISMVIDGDAGKITDSQKQLLDEAFKSSERMVNLINDFLNVSRIQTGKFMLEKSSVDLSQLVQGEIDSLQSNATAHNLKFIYNQPKDFPAVNVDESKIRQVVMNFIDNSIYYSPEDTTVEIKLLVESGEAVFTVKDNGIGVPVGERGQLFTKFYRASNARKRRPDGTGVGIYLAKKIIDAHDGKVIFQSSEGNGSTFGFRLPLK